MKLLIVIIAVLISFNANAADDKAVPECQSVYLAGISQLERGDPQVASELFRQAIELASTPESESIEYLPYIYLAVANMEMGRNSEARDALIQSQIFGVAPKTQTGKTLLDKYAVKIMTAPLDEPEFVTSPQSSPVDNRSSYLSDSEVEIIKAQVLRRCALSSEIEGNKLPWYFHYEFGVDLMKAGDAQRAVDAFVMSANVREDSTRRKRMYGMWFIDYLPYYQIAMAYSKLGKWESANAAIETSENFGEFKPDDADFEKFTALAQLIENHLKKSDS